LQSGTYIFVAKQGIDIANFKALEQEVIFVLKRLNLIDKKT